MAFLCHSVSFQDHSVIIQLAEWQRFILWSTNVYFPDQIWMIVQCRKMQCWIAQIKCCKAKFKIEPYGWFTYKKNKFFSEKICTTYIKPWSKYIIHVHIQILNLTGITVKSIAVTPSFLSSFRHIYGLPLLFKIWPIFLYWSHTPKHTFTLH